MKKHMVAVLLFLLLFTLDIITKHIVVAYISEHERINIIGSFVQFTLLYNKGGLFGIMQGYQIFFLIISLVVLALIVVYYVLEKNKTHLFCSSMALIMSGAAGNILDRLSGKPGVVDFIYIGYRDTRWPAFNIADAVIVIGAVLLLIYYYREEKRRKTDGDAG